MPVTIKRMAMAAVFCLPLSAAIALRAGADDATEARLRDALRTTTEQLHRLEAENAALQTKAQVVTAAPPVREKATPGLNRTIADLKRRLAAAEADSAKSKAASAETIAAAQKKESDSAKTLAGLSAAKERYASCEAKNEALLKIGFELLDRYQNMDFGDALARKEPFTGIKRVELQNIAQDTRAKLRDNTVKP